jgi:transglycosylase-like protein
VRVAALILAGLAIGLPATATAEPPSDRGAALRSVKKKPNCPTAHQGLRWYVERTVHWHARMGATVRVPSTRSAGCPRYLAARWRERARTARRTSERWLRATYEKWRCIHEHEGAWNSNTGNGYYGGLQMDATFYWTYGPEFARRWGHAGNWPVWAQLIAAERAYLTRGFGPWPNTARYCGLL